MCVCARHNVVARACGDQLHCVRRWEQDEAGMSLLVYDTINTLFITTWMCTTSVKIPKARGEFELGFVCLICCVKTFREKALTQRAGCGIDNGPLFMLSMIAHRASMPFVVSYKDTRMSVKTSFLSTIFVSGAKLAVLKICCLSCELETTLTFVYILACDCTRFCSFCQTY